MREVFGERGVHDNSAARANKPTEVGHAAKQLKHGKTTMNKGRMDTGGYLRRGDRCGDRSERWILINEFPSIGQEAPPF
jgi:hypothetical protein